MPTPLFLTRETPKTTNSHLRKLGLGWPSALNSSSQFSPDQSCHPIHNPFYAPVGFERKQPTSSPHATGTAIHLADTRSVSKKLKFGGVSNPKTMTRLLGAL